MSRDPARPDPVDERVAARYDESVAELFDDGVLGPLVDFLAEIAGSGRALELRADSPNRSR